MALEFNYVNIGIGNDTLYDFETEILRRKNTAKNIDHIVIASYKDFKIGFIAYFIAKIEKGKTSFYIRKFKDGGNSSLKYNDHYMDFDYVPEEEYLIDLLKNIK